LSFPILEESNAGVYSLNNHSISPILTKKRRSIFSVRSPRKSISWITNNNNIIREIKSNSIPSVSSSNTDEQGLNFREREESYDHQNKNLADTPLTFLELKEIVDSIHGIFHLL